MIVNNNTGNNYSIKYQPCKKLAFNGDSTVSGKKETAPQEPAAKKRELSLTDIVLIGFCVSSMLSSLVSFFNFRNLT